MHRNSGARGTEVSEEEPVGGFELEDDWNDAEVKLQQCRVSNVGNLPFLTFSHSPTLI